YSPVFQAMLAFQNNEQVTLELPGLTVNVLAEMSEASKFDLTMTLSELSDPEDEAGISGTLTYATDLFDKETVELLVQRFLRILEHVAADSATPVGDIDILTDAERADVEPHAPAPVMTVRELPQLLAAAVRTDPEAVAVSHDGVD